MHQTLHSRMQLLISLSHLRAAGLSLGRVFRGLADPARIRPGADACRLLPARDIY